MSPATALRQRFYRALWIALGIIWPILSVLLGLMLVLGLVIAWVEEWRLFDGIYFALITGLTVGYGDFAPKHTVSRVLAITIGFHGIMLTALFAAITVRALQAAMQEISIGNPDRESIR